MGSIGESWVNANLSVAWAEALNFVQDESKIVMENEVGVKNQVLGFAESLRKLYFTILLI